MRNFFAAICAMAFIGLAGSVSAATINFDGASPGDQFNYVENGLTFDVARIVNGNCDSISGRPCMALNNNETSILTKVGGGVFTLTSFWFQLLGSGTDNTLWVQSDKSLPIALTFSTYGSNNGGQVFDLSGLADFVDVEGVAFWTGDGGNVRVDDISSPTIVPLPAAGFLLLAGLGALAGLGRRKVS